MVRSFCLSGRTHDGPASSRQRHDLLHGSTTTAEAIRRAIRHGQESLRARRALWDEPQDCRSGASEPPLPIAGPVLGSPGQRFCRPSTRPWSLPSAATRSSLHRCLQRHGISRLPGTEGDKPRNCTRRPRAASPATSCASSPRRFPTGSTPAHRRWHALHRTWRRWLRPRTAGKRWRRTSHSSATPSSSPALGSMLSTD
jgi:hypothetical protein